MTSSIQVKRERSPDQAPPAYPVEVKVEPGASPRSPKMRRVEEGDETPQPANSNAAHIPHELILTIFSYLNTRDLLPCARVCRSWRQVGQDDDLWRALSLRDFQHAEDSKEATSDFQKYQNYYAICAIVKKGNYALYQLQGHDSPVLSLTANKGKLYSGDAKGILECRDLKNYKPLSYARPMGDDWMNFLSHTKEGDLLSTYYHQGICIRHLPSGERERIGIPKRAHLYYVANEHKLICGKPNGKVLILHLDLENRIATKIGRLMGHLSSAKAFAYSNAYLITGSASTQEHLSQLKIWKVEQDWKKVTEIAILADGLFSCWIHSIVCTKDMLLAGTTNSKITIWDLKQERVQGELRPIGLNKSRAAVTALTYAYGLVFVGYLDGSVRVWDVRKRICLYDCGKIMPSAIRCLVYADPCKLSVIGENDAQILTLDFTASQSTILEQIAGGLRDVASSLYPYSLIPSGIGEEIWDNITFGIQNNTAFSESKYPSLMKRFDNLPEEVKEKIYSEFQRLLADFGVAVDGSCAFNDSRDIPLHPELLLNLKAQAIENYTATG